MGLYGIWALAHYYYRANKGEERSKQFVLGKVMADAQHPRLILRDFISPALCEELKFIHKSSSTIGYRPNVFSTTLSHLIATNSGHLLMPFVLIREGLKERAEEYFGCEYELFIEFTGLISWTRGASIGWHSDDNRPYLKQRDFAAVCYLNNYGENFGGGLFHFQDGEPATIIPMAGDVLLYTADSRNIHSVDEITFGERLTLTLWFTRDGLHDEDAKLISFLSKSSLNTKSDSYIPLPASHNMYWFPPESSMGFDICCARLHILGYELYSDHSDNSKTSAVGLSDLLIEPLQLARGDELFDTKFSNILHVLQVVQFYSWKGSELHMCEAYKKCKNVVPLSETKDETSISIKLLFVKDHQLAETTLGHVSIEKNAHQNFDWTSFSDAIAAWESYSSKYCQQIRASLPYWKEHNIIFSNPPSDLVGTSN